MIRYETASLAETSVLIQSGALSPVAHVKAVLERIEALNPTLRAFLEHEPEQALAAAQHAQDELSSGVNHGPLHGIAYGLKDLIDREGRKTTCQSLVLADNIASRDAFVTKRLREAGAIYLGKLATDEFACGGAPLDSAWPVPVNPWNAAYITAGSSSGSAVAVASGMLPFALGTDTGGSNRNPHSRCGLVGMKPTYGRVSRQGVFPLSWTQDHVGPATRTVRDNAMALQVMAGHDPQDATSSREPVDNYVRLLDSDLKGVRVGILRNVYRDDPSADAEQVQAIEDAAEVLREAGAVLQEVRLDKMPQITALARSLLAVEAYAIHARWLQEMPEKYGSAARERILQGAWYSSTDYLDLLRHRTEVVMRINAMMADVDVVLTASSYDATPRLDDHEAIAKLSLTQVRTPFSLSGHPALVLPAGISKRTGMPMSLQLAGRHFEEAVVYQVASAYERGAPWQAQGNC